MRRDSATAPPPYKPPAATRTASPPDSFALGALLAPGVTNLYLAPRSVPKVRVSAERRCATEPRARATVSSKGVELVLACAPKPAENAIPTPLRLGRAVRPGGRGIANGRRLAAWPACASDAEDLPRDPAVPIQVHRAGGHDRENVGGWNS